ncbi:CD82 antigen [Aplysia californica]|uniref:Tetraspanin n=1 Tax=Aplysia californica TaxID=6500 RepID=A0ABM1AEJ8_APLCA|nr:CD82 antigen [Aplysia californica]
MENRCMLGIYFVIMLLFLILFVVAAVVSFFFRDDLEDELAKEMTKTLKNDYGLVGNNDITDVWDKIQVELSCCGVRGNRNSESSWFLWQESMWYNVSNTGTNPNALKALPSSCCVKGTSFPDCQNFKTTNQAPMMDAAMVTTDNLSLNEEGCIDKLKDKIDEYIIAIAVIAVVVLIVMFCCVLFSVYVCMHVSRKDMVV